MGCTGFRGRGIFAEPALSGQPGVRVNRIRGRALVCAEVPLEQLSLPVSRVFGVASLSPARETEKDLDAMGATARDLTSQALAGEFAGRERVPFRVTTNRADKTFPMTGMQIDQQLGQLLLENFPALKVDLGHPQLNVEIDLRDEGVWVFAGRRPGPGGLPVGTLGKGMCLLSGGIDSPVAAWLAIDPHTLGAEAFILMGVVTFWISGFDIIYACQDIEIEGPRLPCSVGFT